MAEPVIGGALVAVFEDFVGFVDFLEADFAAGIARILVGVPFHRELAERRLETGLIRIPVDFKGFVVAALGGHPSNPPEIRTHSEGMRPPEDAASGLTKNDPHSSRRRLRALQNEGHGLSPFKQTSC